MPIEKNVYLPLSYHFQGKIQDFSDVLYIPTHN